MGIVELALLVVAATAAVALVELVIRRTDVGAGVVLGLLLVEEALPHIDLGFQVGGIRIGSSDLLVILLLTAAIARLLRVERLTVPQRLFVFILILVVWSIARGSSLHGIPASVNEARKFIRLGTIGLYFSTLEPRRDLLERLGWMWLATAAGLCALTVVRWIGNAAGLTQGLFEGAGGIRAVPSDAALIIAQAAIVALPLLGHRARGHLRFLAPLFLVFVVLLQHRTVWIAAAAGIVYLVYRERTVAKNVLIAIVASLAIFSIFVFTVFEGQDEEVTAQLSDSAQRTGTWEWRVEGWRVLLTDAGPEEPVEVVTGRPFGGGWARAMPGGGVVLASPHNFYLESFLRIGLLGLAALAWIYWVALRRLPHPRYGMSPPADVMSVTTIHVAIAMQLVYYIAYTPDNAQAMLLGIACAAAIRAREPRRVSAATIM